jgi:hypothetical protein
MDKYQADVYQYHVNFSKTKDKDTVDFLKIQGSTIKSARLMMKIMIMLFEKQDLLKAHDDIEKYGLIKVLDEKISNLKKRNK